VTIVNTTAPSYLTLTSVQCGAAADLAERAKHNNYIDLKQKYEFTPLAFETFGSCGDRLEVGQVNKRQNQGG